MNAFPLSRLKKGQQKQGLRQDFATRKGYAAARLLIKYAVLFTSSITAAAVIYLPDSSNALLLQAVVHIPQDTQDVRSTLMPSFPAVRALRGQVLMHSRQPMHLAFQYKSCGEKSVIPGLRTRHTAVDSPLETQVCGCRDRRLQKNALSQIPRPKCCHIRMY